MFVAVLPPQLCGATVTGSPSGCFAVGSFAIHESYVNVLTHAPFIVENKEELMVLQTNWEHTHPTEKQLYQWEPCLFLQVNELLWNADSTILAIWLEDLKVENSNPNSYGESTVWGSGSYTCLQMCLAVGIPLQVRKRWGGLPTALRPLCRLGRTGGSARAQSIFQAAVTGSGINGMLKLWALHKTWVPSHKGSSKNSRIDSFAWNLMLSFLVLGVVWHGLWAEG